MKKKILILATGGTIASTPSPDGLKPTIAISNMIDMYPHIAGHYDLVAKDILNLDSSNVQPEEWIYFAETIFAEAKNGYDGIVLTHGTDTMAYTASMLSFMLKNPSIPIVITGSQLPFTDPLSDGPENLRYALAMAASGVCGVFVAFNRKVMLGCRAVKVRTESFDAFESINYDYIAVENGISKLVPKKPEGEFSLNTNISSNVFLIKLTPGFNPCVFSALCEMEYKGLVIEAFGAGGLHYIHRDLVQGIKGLIDANIPVVVASQCLYERSDLTLYEVGNRMLSCGAIQAFDMTTEAAVTKLMWSLGQAQGVDNVRETFLNNLCGEVNI